MKHKLLSLLLVVVSTLSAQTEVYNGTCGDNLTWDLIDGILTISGTGKMATWKSVYSVPWYDYRESITDVNLPRELENIGQSAFYGCVNLSSITIPDGVTSIGYEAFYMCRSMSAITLGNNIKTISERAFYSCYGFTSITLPESVTYIGSYAFAFCSKLASIEIPNSVTRIESNAFNSCSSLTSVKLSENITYIPQYAFYNCYSLASIELPKGATRIEKNAFCGCKNLASLSIPSSIRYIGEEAFFGCKTLNNIVNRAVEPQLLDNTVFSGNENMLSVDKSSCTLYVPAKSVDAYKAADVWKDFENIVAIPGTEETELLLNYLDFSSEIIDSDNIVLTIPAVPKIEGFHFLKWRIVEGDLEDGINVQAVYEADVTTSMPLEITNPNNPSQKLIREGNVYILQGENTYTLTGKKVK